VTAVGVSQPLAAFPGYSTVAVTCGFHDGRVTASTVAVDPFSTVFRVTLPGVADSGTSPPTWGATV
jgi:hypothetical protein